MQIKDILQLKCAEIVMISPDTKIPAVALKLAEQSIGAAVVRDPVQGVLGILSERDISRGLGKHGGKILEMCVSDLMSPGIITYGLEWKVSKALNLMLSKNIRNLPVVEDDLEVVGIVSMRDVAAIHPEEMK